MIIAIIILIILIILLKFDIRIKENWDGIYFIWKTVEKDAISGEYYTIFKSKKLINFKN